MAAGEEKFLSLTVPPRELMVIRICFFLLLGLTYLNEEHSCGTVTDSNRLLFVGKHKDSVKNDFLKVF